MLKPTRLAPTALAFALCRDAAIGANLRVTVAEVLTVYITVAGHAKRDAIGYVKAKISKLGERFDVVSVKVDTLRSTLLAGVVVPLEYGLAPPRQLVTHAGAFAIQRLAVLPSRGVLPDPVSRRAFPRAVHRTSVGDGFEGLAAVEARLQRRPVRPARLTTVLRRFRAIGMLLVLRTANGAGECYSGSAGEDRTSFDCWHESIITQNDPHYCDVIIRRWEEFTGGTAVLVADDLMSSGKPHELP